MELVNDASGPKYSFENDISGRLFGWLIESGRVDFQAMIDETAQGEPDPQSWVKRLADVLEAKVGQSWTPVPPPPASKPAEDTATRPKAPAYNIWFRPSPSKKIKFKEVARGPLVFTGRRPWWITAHLASRVKAFAPLATTRRPAVGRPADPLRGTPRCPEVPRRGLRHLLPCALRNRSAPSVSSLGYGAANQLQTSQVSTGATTYQYDLARKPATDDLAGRHDHQHLGRREPACQGAISQRGVDTSLIMGTGWSYYTVTSTPRGVTITYYYSIVFACVLRVKNLPSAQARPIRENAGRRCVLAGRAWWLFREV